MTEAESLALVRRLLDGAPGQPAAIDSASPRGAAVSKSTPNFGNAADLRALLEAALEALTLPTDIDDYDQRMRDRATWARVTLKGALEEAPEDIGWNVDYLRGKLAAEQADADERTKAGERA